MIGDWSEPTTTTSSSTAHYSLNLIGVRVPLKQLNKHVLECTLPKFDSIYTNYNESVVSQIEITSSHYALSTCLHVYENERMCCEPAPFEIRFSRRTTQINSNPTRPIFFENSNNKNNFKHRFFLLERILALLNAYQLPAAQFDFFDVSNNNNNNPSKTSADAFSASSRSSCSEAAASSSLANAEYASRWQSFEARLCLMLEQFLVVRSWLSHENRQRRQHKQLQLFMDSEHEGKTLLHLCAVSDMTNLFARLIQIKNILVNEEKKNDNDNIAEVCLIRNELKLLKFDQDGFTPLVKKLIKNFFY